MRRLAASVLAAASFLALLAGPAQAVTPAFAPADDGPLCSGIFDDALAIDLPIASPDSFPLGCLDS